MISRALVVSDRSKTYLCYSGLAFILIISLILFFLNLGFGDLMLSAVLFAFNAATVVLLFVTAFIPERFLGMENSLRNLATAFAFGMVGVFVSYVLIVSVVVWGEYPGSLNGPVSFFCCIATLAVYVYLNLIGR